MGFQKIAYEERGAEFNSALASDFLEFCNKIQEDKVQAARTKRSSKTFAPSSMHCDRVSFFRLRGTEPDKDIKVDKSMEFMAMLGKAMHEDAQADIKRTLGPNWLDVAEYLVSRGIPAETKVSESGLETLVRFSDPPVKFAVDGLLRWQGEIILFEMKSCEYESFRSLSGVKPHHVDQVDCYLTMLDLCKSLVLYRERRYGGMKCFEHSIKDSGKRALRARMDNVMECAEAGIAPPKLPAGDKACSVCKYKTACRQWG